LELQKWDIVKVYSIWDLQYREFVDVYGEVKNPGKYFLRKGMTIQDIVLLAGGFSNDAYKDTIEISRITSSDANSGNKTEFRRVNVSADFFKTSTYRLKHQDVIFVRKDAKKRPQEVVFLGGEFVFPGYYSKLTADETLSSLIKRAGGFNNHAYLDGTIFKRSKDSVGNVAINFEALINRNRRREDIILENGDSIIAPTMPRTAAVSGGVNYPTSIKFEKRKPVSYYLSQAGGLTDLGKRGNIYVVRANGEVRSVRKSDKRAVNAGTEIVVVEGEKRVKNPASVIQALSAISTMGLTIMTILTLRKDL
jgi:protein involved in polysaccharide export with SLBB domain